MKDFIQGIKNLFIYFKIIWKDRDWDYFFMDNMLLFKMKRMLLTLKKDIFEVEGNKDLKSLSICIKILERRKSDWYSNVYYRNIGYKEQFLFEPYKDDLFELKITGLNKEEEKISYDLWKKLRKVEKRDWRIFCQILEKYSDSWWS